MAGVQGAESARDQDLELFIGNGSIAVLVDVFHHFLPLSVGHLVADHGCHHLLQLPERYAAGVVRVEESEGLFELGFSKEHVLVGSAERPLSVVDLSAAVHVDLAPDQVCLQLKLRLGLPLAIESLVTIYELFLGDLPIPILVNGLEGLSEAIDLSLGGKLEDHVLEGGLLEV